MAISHSQGFFFAIFWPSLQRGTFSWQSSGLWRSPKIAPLFRKPFQFRGIRSGLKLVLVYLLVLEEWKKKRKKECYWKWPIALPERIAWASHLTSTCFSLINNIKSLNDTTTIVPADNDAILFSRIRNKTNQVIFFFFGWGGGLNISKANLVKNPSQVCQTFPQMLIDFEK